MIYISMLLIFLLLIFMTSFTPYVTRKTESFGITIPSEYYNHAEIVGYRKSYAKQSGIIGLLFFILLIVLAFPVSEQTWTIFYIIGLFAYIAITFFIYYQFHKRMKQLKEKENWKGIKKEVLAIDLSFYHQKLTYSNRWFLIPFIITVISLLWIFLNYDSIPDRVPMHYSLNGEVTNWADKSYKMVILFPLLQLFMTGLFLFVNIVIARSKQQVDPSNPEESIKQNIIFRRRWSLFTILSGNLLVLLFILPPVSFVYPINPVFLFTIIMAVTILIVIGAIVLTMMTGQGGSRVSAAVTKNGETVNRDDDQYWKLGVFYFNPDDPAVWVEKRFGSGWTANFARPTAWIFIVIIFLIPILIAWFAS